MKARKISILHRTQSLFAAFFVVVFLVVLAGCGPSVEVASGKLFAPPEDKALLRAVDSESVVVAPQGPAPKPSSFALLESITGEQDAPIERAVDTALSLFPAHESSINDIAVHPLLPVVYTAGADGKVMQHRLVRNSSRAFWERKDLKGLESSVVLEGERQVLSLAISVDGKFLAAAEQGQVVVYDLDANKVVNSLTRIRARITALSWDPRGEMLAMGLATGDVYLWNLRRGEYAGSDSFDALEVYPGGLSAIVSLHFHPSGRSLFVVEREGIAHFWRLLRTEEELGIRDVVAAVDKANRGRLVETFVRARINFEDSWLSPDGATLLISGGTGQVFRWKTRGLRQLNGIETGKGVTFTVAAIPETTDNAATDKFRSNRPYPIVMTAGRSRGLLFWCFADTDEAKDIWLRTSPRAKPVTVEEVSTADEEEEKAPRGARLLVESLEAGQAISKLRVSERWGILWAVQKTGSLAVLDLRKVLEDRDLNRAAHSCTVSGT